MHYINLDLEIETGQESRIQMRNKSAFDRIRSRNGPSRQDSRESEKQQANIEYLTKLLNDEQTLKRQEKLMGCKSRKLHHTFLNQGVYKKIQRFTY